jgi:predicted nucleic acid-binding protein
VILVDTSVWIEFLNFGNRPAAREMERLIREDAQLAVTGVVVTEILQGIKRDAAAIAGLLRRWPMIEPTGFVTYEAAAAISREARSRGFTVATIDSLIAAIALEYQAELFTLDQDFQRLRFSGIRLYELKA